MYDEYYQNRLNIQQACSFFMNGVSNKNFEKGTPEERYQRNSENLYQYLEETRKKILTVDWSVIKDKKKKEIKTEDLFENVIITCEDNQALCYEMGFRAGFLFTQDIYGLK